MRNYKLCAHSPIVGSGNKRSTAFFLA